MRSLGLRGAHEAPRVHYARRRRGGGRAHTGARANLSIAHDHHRGPVPARRRRRLRGPPARRPSRRHVGTEGRGREQGRSGRRDRARLRRARRARRLHDHDRAAFACRHSRRQPAGGQASPLRDGPIRAARADVCRSAHPGGEKLIAVNSFKDFIAAVKANPGQIPYGTSGHLGTVHLAMEMFLTAAQLKMVHVPYQGGGPSFNALLSGQVPVVPTLASTAKGQIDAGNVRILAQWGTERLPNFPQAPTLQEAGYPDVIYILWTSVFAPAKAPAHVTRILRDAIRPFMQDKAVIERFEKAGSQVSYLDGPEFARFLEADTDRLLKVVRQIGLS